MTLTGSLWKDLPDYKFFKRDVGKKNWRLCTLATLCKEEQNKGAKRG